MSSSENKKRKASSSCISKDDIEGIHDCLAKFIVGCGLAFSVVENKFFKEFVAALNQPYRQKLPSRKVLSNRLLDRLYETVKDVTRKIVPNQVCLLADSWRNKSAKHMNFAVIIHNADGPPLFVESFDMTCESESAENLSLCVSI